MYNLFYLIADPSIWKALQKRFSRNQAGVISDIVDGAVYKEHSAFLDNPANVSFTLNTDGVSIFRSSSTSIWPVWLVINELPAEQRYVSPSFSFTRPIPLIL